MEQAGVRNARLRHAEHHRGACPARIQQRRRQHPTDESASHQVSLEHHSSLDQLHRARAYNLKPAVAALIAGRLVDSLGQIAADQRSTTVSSVRRFHPADLDTLVQDTQTVVDVHGLDSAVRLGVCDIADYAAQPATTQSRFLQGIDAVPAHIGSGYDVLRFTPARAVQRAIETARYALIAGPSGAGKSTQVWRSARDIATAVQVIRVHRVQNDADVAELVRHVQLLEPSDTHSVVVCCDDLGRPRTRA